MAAQREIIVVSGLPRSGTSLMMQMLELGGIAPLTDAIRAADVDNPKGYYEFERAKKTKHDPTWLPQARGKAVKMISQLLYDLPATETYQVLFMRRDLDEVVRSQEKMLIRLGQPVPDRSSIKVAFQRHLEKLLAWLPSQPTLQLLEVNYNHLLTDPQAPTKQIAAFLALPVDRELMLAAIDASLYRNRDVAVQ